MKKFSSLVFIMLCTSVLFSQKLKITKGSFKNLKSIKEYSLVFDYENVEIPKFDSEEDFLKEKMEKRDDKEEESGEAFRKSWFADRENKYEPKFMESFNKRFDDEAVKVGKKAAEYTLHIKTTLMYAGYNVGVWRQNSKIEAILTVYSTNNPTDILFSGEYTKVEGLGAMGYDFNSGYRISEAYAKLAKEFAKDLSKKALK